MPRLLILVALLGATACSRPPRTQGSAALSERAQEGRIVVGTPEDTEVAALLEVLAPGITLEGPVWAIGGFRSPRRGALVVAVLEDPGNPGVPVTLAVSDEPALVAEATPRLGGGWRPCVELWRVGHRELTGRLTSKGRLREDTLLVDEFEEGMVADVLQHPSGLEVRYFIDERISVARLDAYVTELVEAVRAAGAELPATLQIIARVEGDQLGFVDPASGALAVVLAGQLDDGGTAYVAHLVGEPAQELAPEASADPRGNLVGELENGERYVRVHVPAGPSIQDGGPWRRTDVTLEGDTRNLCRIANARAGGGPVAVELVFVRSASTSFDGDRVLTTAAEWAQHFDLRANAARHVARLAELGGADLLLIGAGPMRSARTVWPSSVEEPDGLREPRVARLEGWTELVAQVRALYGGPVGYVADLGTRAKDVGFWAQLDVVGLRMQPPPLGNRRTMRNRFTGNLVWGAEFGATHGKPVLYLAPGLDRAQRDALLDAWDQADEGLRGAGLLIGGLDEDQAARLR